MTEVLIADGNDGIDRWVGNHGKGLSNRYINDFISILKKNFF